MKLQKLTIRIIAVLFAFSAVACVDKDFRLDEASMEMTLGQGKTIIPLGYLKEQTIGDLLNTGQAIEGLSIDPDTGEYSFSFKGDAASFGVEGIPTSLGIPAMVNSFSVAYPEFNLSAKSVEIHQGKEMKLNMGVLDKFGVSGSYRVPFKVENAITGNLTETITPEHLYVQVPEQIEDIVAVFFKDIESGHQGAPLHLKLDLNDLKGINGGGELNIDLKLAGGNFIMADGDGNRYDDNHFAKSYKIKEGDEFVEFVLYIDRIVNDKTLDSNHALDIPLSLTYDLDFSLDVMPGEFSLANLPKFNVDADLEYGDADVMLSKSVMLVDYHSTEANDVVIDSIPAEIVSVKSINLKDNSRIQLFARGLDWFGDAADLIEVDITLPGYLSLHSLEGVTYEYVESAHQLKATLADLEKGIDIGLDAIEFEGDGVRPEGGKLHLDFAPDIEVHFAKDAEIMVSSLMPENVENIVISTGIDAMEFTIESVSGCIAYGYDYSQKVQLGDLTGGMGLEINGEGLSPIIRIEIGNPLSLEATIGASITPMVGGEVRSENVISFDNLTIAPAEYVNGEIVPSKMYLVLADESRREEFEGGDYTFVACSVGKLLAGAMPDGLILDFSVDTNSEEVSTLYVAEEFELSYSYSLDVPLAFNSDLSIGYSGRAEGLKNTFELLSGYDIKIGDLALLVNAVNSAPLQFAINAQLLDANGEPTSINLHIPEGGGIIKGSDDGVKGAESQMRLELKVPSGDLSGLGDVDAINFDFELKGVTKDSVPLKDSQSVSVMLQLELDGGVTIDLGSFVDASRIE